MKRCGECGKGTIRPITKPGRTARYKVMEIAIPSDFEIPTCDNCGAEWLDKNTALALDEVLETIYKQELSRRAKQAIEEITRSKPQRDVEMLLGVSPGYLSKLKSGSRFPSPELVGQLALLAKDPTRRLLELQNYWQTK